MSGGKKNRQSSINAAFFRAMSRSAIVFILLLLLVTSLIFFDRILDIERESSRSHLSYVADQLTYYMKTVDNYSKTIMVDAAIQSYMLRYNNDRPDLNALDEMNIKRKISHIIQSTDFIHSVTLYSPERHIDIVMLDIKMPQMSGMDAADQIHQLYPHVKIVILSGFNDFDYARSAMRYGVVDYLLKPADPEALTEALTRCIKHLERDAITYRQEQRLLHYEKRVNLSAVLSGGMSPQDLRSRYPELEDVECTWFAGCYIHTEAESEIEKLVAWLKQEGCDCEYHKELDYSYVLQFFLHNDCDAGNIETLLAGYIDQLLSADNQVYIFLCLGSPCEFDQSWSSAYSAAGQALDYRYFTDKNLIHLSKYPDTAI
ncbi:MAG: two-component system, response regulator YesN [Clostridiales bacterium]|nr:two-component system, response regulator YesN [Clostridiales bacterium]